MRQTRDKAALGTAALEDPLPGVPLDAEGNPIFLVLPLSMRADYEQRLAACEEAWRMTRNPHIAAEALTWAHIYRWPVPAWLHEAVWAVASERRGKAHAQRALIAAKHALRYMAVRDARTDGFTWGESYGRAADRLSDTFANGEPEVMKVSYAQVKADLKRGRHARYHTIQVPSFLRRTAGGK